MPSLYQMKEAMINDHAYTIGTMVSKAADHTACREVPGRHRRHS
jgi:hypothetical protein